MMKYFTRRWNLHKGTKRLNLLKNEVSRIYVNQELIAFMKNLTDYSTPQILDSCLNV